MDGLIANIAAANPANEEDADMLAGAASVALEQLTDEERQALIAQLMAQQAQALAQREDVLNKLATTLVAKRTEYMNGRQALGIELEWQEDEDAYEGIDDANRNEEARYRPRKPTESGGSAVTQATTSRSTVFMNITAPYTDAAANKVADMLLPTDDRAWQLKPTPLPELPGMAGTPESQAQMAAGMQPSAGAEQQQPQPQLSPEQAAAGMVNGVQPAQPSPEAQAKTQLAKFLEDMKAEAARKAENAQDLIDDWLTECNFHKEARTVIQDAARIGSGVLKGPFPVMRRRKRWAKGPNGKPQLERYEDYTPASRAISPWDFFPDPACGEDIHAGGGCFERDRLSPRVLADLRGQPGYFDDQIEACLKEGPSKHVDQGRLDIPRDAVIDKQQFETWYFHGVLERADLEVLGVDLADVGDTALYVPIMAQLVNDRVIKVALNPLSNGKFPYDLLRWSKRKGICWGKGVARKIRTPQRMVNAGTRNMMDNAGLSASIILLLRKAGLQPADGNWKIGGGLKVLYVDDAQAKTQRAEDSMKSVEIPSRQAELLAIIEFSLRMAEQVTGLPMLLQGHQGRAPDTLGVAQQLQNNANGMLRGHAKAFDDDITEPHIGRYYDWLQEYADDPEVQGDFQIDARGSSALVERELQNQWIAQMAAYVGNPQFKINPAKWFEEFSKSVRFDPKRIQYTDEEWKNIQNQPPPKAPQVEAAEIRETGATQRKEMELAAAREQKMLDLIAQEGLSADELKARMLELLTTDRRERDLFVAQRAVKDKHGESVDMPG